MCSDLISLNALFLACKICLGKSRSVGNIAKLGNEELGSVERMNNWVNVELNVSLNKKQWTAQFGLFSKTWFYYHVMKWEGGKNKISKIFCYKIF